jgi:hypothetical protein
MQDWNQKIQEAFGGKKPFLSYSLMDIPVSADNFSAETKKYSNVKKAILKGSIYTRISEVYSPAGELACYELMYCVEEGDHGDVDGFGVEPDTWIISWLDPEGNFITPFYLEDEPEYRKYHALAMRTKYSGVFGYEFIRFNDHKEIAITGYYGIDSHVAIPDKIAGYPVTKIGNRAFIGSRLIRSVIIPLGIKSIGNRAFEECINLESISVSDSVTSIGFSAFYGCKSLTETKLPEGLSV